MVGPTQLKKTDDGRLVCLALSFWMGLKSNQNEQLPFFIEASYMGEGRGGGGIGVGGVDDTVVDQASF